jgi:hypothetical protein
MKIKVYQIVYDQGNIGKRFMAEMITPIGATAIKILCVNENGFIPDSSVTIPVPRQKVKKYRWYLDFEGLRVTTDDHMEHHPSNLSHLSWRKVEGSEVAE